MPYAGRNSRGKLTSRWKINRIENLQAQGNVCTNVMVLRVRMPVVRCGSQQDVLFVMVAVSSHFQK